MHLGTCWTCSWTRHSQARHEQQYLEQPLLPLAYLWQQQRPLVGRQ
jgi:hypothetical protein